MPFIAKRHFTIMKTINPKFFFTPVISFVFIIGVISIGIDVRLKLKEIESRSYILEGLNRIQKDLNLFIADITYFRNIQSEKHLRFLKEQQGSILIETEEIDPIIDFFRPMKAIPNFVRLLKFRFEFSL